MLPWLLLTVFPAQFGPITSTNDSQRILFLVGILIAFLCVAIRPRVTLQLIEKSREAVAILLICLIYYSLVVMLAGKWSSAGDLADVLRPVVYLSFIIVPVLFAGCSSVGRSTWYVFVVIAAIQFVANFAVYVESLWPIIDVFKGRQSDDPVAFHFFRWSGLFAYPSDYSFFSLFVAMYAFQLLLGGGITGAQRWICRATLAGSIVAIMLSLSRAGIGALLVMMPIAVLWSDAPFRVRVIWLMIGMGVAVLLATALFSYLESLPEGTARQIAYVTDLLTGEGSDSSTSHRQRELELARERSSDAWPMAPGPDREFVAERLPIVESYYGLHLIKWGALGLLLALSFVGAVAASLSADLRRVSDVYARALVRATVLLLLSVPLVFGWSSAMGDRFKTLPFLYMLIGLSALVVRSVKKRELMA